MANTRLSIALLCLLVCAGALPDLYLSQSLPAVSGTVRDVDGHPVEGVQLFLAADTLSPDADFNVATLPLAATTDASGRFRLQVQAPGRYLVIPVKQGLVYSRRRSATGEPGVWISVSGPQGPGDVSITLVPESSIGGIVIDPTGLPAVDIHMRLLQYAYDDEGERILTSAGRQWNGVRTNDRGEYRFYALPPGEYYLSVFAIAPAGRWAPVFYPGTVDEQRAERLLIKPGEDLTLNTLRLVQRETVAVRLRFPAYVTKGTSITSVHFADGSSSMTLGGGFGSRQVETEHVGEERILDLTRGVHDVMVNWGTLGGSQNYSGSLLLDATGAAVTHELVAAPLVRVRMTASLLRAGASRSSLRTALLSALQLPVDSSRVYGRDARPRRCLRCEIRWFAARRLYCCCPGGK